MKQFSIVNNFSTMNRLDGSNISSTFSFDQLPSFREQERQRAINLKPLPSFGEATVSVSFPFRGTIPGGW